MAFSETEIADMIQNVDGIIAANLLGERKLNDQDVARLENLKGLLNLKINPYPAEKFEVTHYATDIKQKFDDENPEAIGEVSMAGRIMAKRGKGAVLFAEVQDSTERIQLFIKRDALCPDENKDFYNLGVKKLLDLGDYVGVRGTIFKTKMGEISVRVSEFVFLSKSLRPLPIVKRDEDGNVFDGFTNPELRYRQRYVDLTVNPEVKKVFMMRSKLMTTMRQFFDAKGWLEVETPILQTVHGGAAARPFETHHNTLDMPLTLRIANELYLKRLIVGGFEGVYEIGKMFRNEGMDATHNPEFTAMEIYVAYKDYIWMMKMVEDLLEEITKTLHNGKTAIQIGDHQVEFKGPYRKLSMYDSIKEYTGIDVSEMDEAGLRQTCKDLHIAVDPSMGKGKLVDEIFSEKVEHHLIQPTYITDYPIEMTPLAKKHRTKEGLVERFELFMMGKEIANAYTELNDPIDQRGRFLDQMALANRGDKDAMVIDEDFLRALEYGMPPTSGLGIGIDRLVMMMTNNSSIQEVLLFPQMKAEVTHTIEAE
jgi:lysyl-tRNA synthetase class 2